MPYDDILVERVRRAMSSYGEPSERELFGGLMFYLDGRMCAGVVNDQLVLRMSPDAAAEALARNRIDPMGEANIPGIISVSPAGHELEEDLAEWIRLAVEGA
jgi:hypothetical protein